jgi:hypothetical protein
MSDLALGNPTTRHGAPTLLASADKSGAKAPDKGSGDVAWALKAKSPAAANALNCRAMLRLHA